MLTWKGDWWTSHHPEWQVTLFASFSTFPWPAPPTPCSYSLPVTSSTFHSSCHLFMFTTCASHQGCETWRLCLFLLKPKYLGVEECLAHGQGILNVKRGNEWMNEWTSVGWSCSHLDFWDRSLSLLHYVTSLCLNYKVKSLSRVWLCDPMDCSLRGSSVHGIFQARILEWVSISFSRGSSKPRDRIRVSRIGGRCFTVWATREALERWSR